MSVYVIDSADRIVSVDAAFVAFARENGAADLEHVAGQSLWDMIAGVETHGLWHQILSSSRTRRQAFLCRYRCDSPDRRRLFHLHLQPRPDGSIVFASHLVRQEPRTPLDLLDPTTRHGDAALRICSWCNRARVAADWVEIEGAVKQLDLLSLDRPPAVTHGICPACRAAVLRTLDGHPAELPTALR